MDGLEPRLTLYLVRHGHYASDQQPEDGLGGALTVRGRQQVRRLAPRLARLAPQVIYHSDLRRAAETAGLLGAALPEVKLRATPLLREGLPVVPLGFEDEFGALDPAELARDRERMERAYQRFFRFRRGPVRRVALVCHGNIIRYFICRVLRQEPERLSGLDLRHASLTEVALAPRWQRVNAFGDVGHLPESLYSFI